MPGLPIPTVIIDHRKRYFLLHTLYDLSLPCCENFGIYQLNFLSAKRIILHIFCYRKDLP